MKGIEVHLMGVLYNVWRGLGFTGRNGSVTHTMYHVKVPFIHRTTPGNSLV